MALLRSLTFEGIGASVDGEFPYFDGTKYSPRFLYDYLVGTNGFRVTTESGVPVSTSDRTAQSTLYLTPHAGNTIAIYDGTRWYLRESAEVSLALSGLTSGLPYDLFAYWTGSAVALEALAWTSTTARATAVVQLDGVWVKSGTTTRRLVATFYTTSTTTTEDSKANRYVFNVSNQVEREMYLEDANSHTYTGAAREWRGVTTRLSIMAGLPMKFDVSMSCLTSTSSSSLGCRWGVGLNAVGYSNGVAQNTVTTGMRFAWNAQIGAGARHNELIASQNGSGSGTQSFNNLVLTALVVM